MIGRIILEISVVFVVYAFGYTMGFKACSRCIKDAIKRRSRKND